MHSRTKISIGVEQHSDSLSRKTPTMPQDSNPRVQLTLLLRIADDQSKESVPGELLSGLVLVSRSIAKDDVLLDAWTSAVSTNPIPILLAVVNSNDAQADRNLSARVAVSACCALESNGGENCSATGSRCELETDRCCMGRVGSRLA